MGTSLEKEDEIPQADNYTVTYVYDVDASSYSLSVSIQVLDRAENLPKLFLNLFGDM